MTTFHQSSYLFLQLIIICLFFTFYGYVLARTSKQPANGQLLAKFDKLRVTPENYEKVRQMHHKLYHGAVKALIGQVGKKHFKHISKAQQQRLSRCLDRIENRMDLASAAKCLVESRRRHHNDELGLGKGKAEESRSREQMAFVQENEHTSSQGKFFRQKVVEKATRLNWLKLRWVKMNGHNTDSETKGTRKRLIGTKQLLQYINDSIRKRRMGRSIMDDENGTFLETDQIKAIHSQSAPPLSSRSDKPLASRITNVLLKAMGARAERANQRWSNVYGTLKRLMGKVERRRKFPGTKVFEKRMYDIVLDREEASLSPKERGVQLIDAMISNRTNNSANLASQPQSNNLRLFSPRFMPLAPDKGGSVNKNSLLSPTLLAMYEENDNGTVGNVPEILKKAGLGEKERQKLISALMDITGATDKVERTLQMFREANFFDEVGGPLMKATHRMVNAFFAMEDSMDPQQKSHCEQNGYTFARKEQIEKLLRDQAVDLSQLPDLGNFDVYDRMSLEEKELALWATIEHIAEGKTFNGSHSNHTASRHRMKRTFAPHIMEPIILSPFTFAPTYGLVVLGPTILSPNTFSPSVLAPAVFSPTILSPSIFNPAILSPAVGSTGVLSPSVAHPFILSPLLLGGFVLNPFVLAPFILAPVALGPNIMNPYVLSPIILNPLVLSPDVVSPQALGGAILSPVMLSPAILTQGYLMVSILSPSFLS